MVYYSQDKYKRLQKKPQTFAKKQLTLSVKKENEHYGKRSYFQNNIPGGIRSSES
jgi:hypothetical protein